VGRQSISSKLLTIPDAKPMGWSIIGPLIMLRWLKINGRAFIENGEKENIVNTFMDVSEDELFIKILEYLGLYRK
jgi:hypothetical protein